MSIALSEFWTRLVHSGVADPEACKQFATAYCDAHQGAPATDTIAMAKFLVKSGSLTAFQSASLLSDPPVNLRLGNYVQSSDKPSMPLGHWLPVQTLARAPDGGPRHGFLLRVPANQLSETMSQWLAAHAAVTHPQLQEIQLQADGEGGVAVFSPLDAGRSLSDLTQKKMKVARSQTLAISISIANALSAMHAANLVHGEVRADRVWMMSGGQAILLRDPSGPARVPRADSAYGWIHATERSGAYSAPEFANPNQACTVSTDIYSLGCLMFRMAVGRLPMDDAATNLDQGIETQIASHLTHVPPELTQAIEQGESGDPLLRVIAFAMAKSSAARFTSAEQVADALSAVQASLSATSVEKKVAVEKKSSPEKKASVAVDPPKQQKSTKQKTTKQKPAVQAPTQEPASPVRSESKPADVVQTPQLKTAAPPKSPENATPPPVVGEAALPVSHSPTPPVAATPVAAVPVPAAAASELKQPDKTPPEPSVEQLAAERLAAEQPSEAAPPVRRRRRKKKNNVPFILGVLAIPLLATFIMLLARGSAGPESDDRQSRPPLPVVVPPVASSQRTPEQIAAATKQSPTAATGGYQLVSGGKYPWAPPYAAGEKPPSLALLPPGPAAIVSVRLSALMADPAGREVLQSLSPELTGMIKQAADRARLPVDAIKRLSLALHPDQNGWPEASLVVELNEPTSLKTLSDTWQVAAARTPAGVTIYAGDEPDADAFFIGDSQKGAIAPDASVTRFAVGSMARIKSVAEIEGGVIPLPRAMQKLWDGSSNAAHLVALVTPNFLFADGRELLGTTAPELVKPLKRLLITDFAGVLVSLTAQDSVVYSELRAVPSGNVSSAALMRTLSKAFESWPSWADSFSVDAVPDRSWRRLANRLPQMMRFFVDHTRLGVEDDVVIANNYLPATAASQIALATLLAMNTKPGEAVAANVAVTTKPLSVDEMLDRKMSVAFDQESLEFAVDAVIDEFKQSLPAGSTMPDVRIVGSDLEKMGITQNQQIRDFNKNDMPLRAVLTDLVLGANPDKTATGPDDPKQSLVWVVHEESGKKLILITTRVASDGKYELPPEFTPK